MTIQLRGQAEVQRMLRDYTNPKFPRRLQAATKAGANVFKADVKAEAAKVSKRLGRSVSVRTAKRDKPASVLTFRPKVAFFRHFVIGGTKEHGPRKAKVLAFKGRNGSVVVKRVRGVKPNPIIARVFGRLESRAYAAIDQELTRSEGA